TDCKQDSTVEKNEEADQKIEQDGTINKPEDKAHKAATKIQASFRGHITRKKMKDGEEEKEGDSNGKNSLPRFNKQIKQKHFE
uniref:Neuromodulin n=1 Tax=Mola mola TaxID=94237 RepID=A0A3Q3W557_MOLML